MPSCVTLLKRACSHAARRNAPTSTDHWEKRGGETLGHCPTHKDEGDLRGTEGVRMGKAGVEECWPAG